MQFEPNDCVDTINLEVAFDSFIKLPNVYNANKALVQVHCAKNEFATVDEYKDVIEEPIAILSEHFEKLADFPYNNGILMMQFGIYEIQNATNIKNCSIKNLLPDAYNLYVKVNYYK